MSLQISKQQYHIQQLAQLIALEKQQNNPDKILKNEDMQDEQH